jgi:hypothetical protein
MNVAGNDNSMIYGTFLMLLRSVVQEIVV